MFCDEGFKVESSESWRGGGKSGLFLQLTNGNSSLPQVGEPSGFQGIGRELLCVYTRFPHQLPGEVGYVKGVKRLE
jgi:hypothetical protein